MPQSTQILFISIYFAILLSIAYSGVKQCKCIRDFSFLCLKCPSGCRTSLVGCISCPDNCVKCFNSTSCTVCEPGHWGKTCEKICRSEHCKGNTCLKDTGLCTDGCIEGYFGVKSCEKCPRSCLTCFSQTYCDKCQVGFTGSDCRFRCDNCIDGQCSNNRCTQGCISGYFPSFSLIQSRVHVPPCFKCPDHCKTCSSASDCLTCKTGFYGRGCQYRCIECKNELCNKTGCIEGCADGYFMESLKTDSHCIKCPENCAACSSNNMCESCQKGFYGDKCQHKCDVNCLNNVCKNTNGVCLLGCITGFYLSINTCVSCPSCHENGRCDGDSCHFTCCQVMTSPDTCIVENCLACKENKSDKCNVCENGFFRSKVDNCITCPRRCKGDKCKDVSGRCIDGCVEGWTGSNCNVKCSNETCLTGEAKQSDDEPQDTSVVLGSVVGGVIFLLILVGLVIFVATVRRRKSRLSSAYQPGSNVTQDSNGESTPPGVTYVNNACNSDVMNGNIPENGSDMTSPTYEEISCYVEESQQYEDLDVRDEHIYMQGVDEEPDYIN